MNLQNPRRTELSGIPYLNNALDFIQTKINAIWGIEHDGDGHHTDITATSVTSTGAVTVTGEGSFTENVTAQAGEDDYQVEIGNVNAGTVPNSTVAGIAMAITDGWVMGTRASQSPNVNGGNEWVAFYKKVSTAEPALRLVDDSTNIILALNSTFTASRGVALGEDATGKRFAAVHALAYYESGTRIGAWTTPSYNAGDFTASAGTWTVDSGDVITYAYTTVHKLMTVAFEIHTTDVSATPVTLRIAVPGGATIAKQMRNVITVINAGAAATSGNVVAIAGTTYLSCYVDFTGTSTWTATAADNTYVLGQITFEVV